MTPKDLSSGVGSRLPAADDVLELIGLQQQRTVSDVTLGMLGSFALGAIVGGGLALFFAPKPGEELRRELGHGLDDARQKVESI